MLIGSNKLLHIKKKIASYVVPYHIHLLSIDFNAEYNSLSHRMLTFFYKYGLTFTKNSV